METTQHPKLVMVEYNGTQLPYLNNMAAMRKLSAATGIASLSGIETAINEASKNPDLVASIELLGKYNFYALQEGHRVAKKEFTLQLDDVLETELMMAITDAINKKFGTPQYSATEINNQADEGNGQTQPN